MPMRPRRSISSYAEDFPDVKLSSDGTWHRVRLGPFDKRKHAERTQRQLQRQGIDAFLTLL